MGSGKQKKSVIKRRRREQARRIDPIARGVGLPNPPRGAVMSDLSQLAHDKTYGPRPLFYVDRQFACRACGTKEVWTAIDQKWWYEVAKGKIESTAVFCSTCRKAQRAQADVARVAHLDGLVAKYGIEEAAQRLKRPADDVRSMLARLKLRRRAHRE